MPFGGDGIVAVPHDPAAITNPDPSNPLRPAFLETFNSAAEIDLLRYYTDEGYQGLLPADGDARRARRRGGRGGVGSSNQRPFLVKERQYGVTIEPNGTNSRGIAIDPTPRIACEQAALAAGTLSVTDPASTSPARRLPRASSSRAARPRRCSWAPSEP